MSDKCKCCKTNLAKKDPLKLMLYCYFCANYIIALIDTRDEALVKKAESIAKNFVKKWNKKQEIER